MGQGVEGVYVPGQSIIDVSKNRLFTTSSTNPNKSDSILMYTHIKDQHL